MSLLYALFLTVCLGTLVYLAILLYRLRVMTDALRMEFESFDRLRAWRLQNPGVYIGLSPEGRALVIERIRAFAMYCDVFAIDGSEHLALLASLLNELPPKSPHSAPVRTQHPAFAGCFLYRRRRLPSPVCNMGCCTARS